MKNRKETKRKGFTLVELLIVIVVIGILSAMMMLSSTEAVSSARASTIVSNLRNLKTAALAWYVDNMDKIVLADGVYKIDTTGDGKGNMLISDYVDEKNSEILKYLSNGDSINLKGKKNTTADTYMLVAAKKAKKLYVCYVLSASDTQVKVKLASKANSVGLLGTNNPNVNGDADIDQDAYKAQKYVCMLAFKIDD